MIFLDAGLEVRGTALRFSTKFYFLYAQLSPRLGFFYA